MIPKRIALPLLAPALILIVGLTLYPILRTLALSFFSTEYGFEGARFVGFGNYSMLIEDRFFLRALRNTVVFALTATAGEVLFGLALALLFNRAFPARNMLILCVVLPYLLSTMVVTAIWGAWFHYDYGYLNNLLRAVGLPGWAWLSDPQTALLSLVAIDIWQTSPFVFLILLAGLQAIDPDIYEAAAIDGATGFGAFRSITLPLLMPHILLAALLRLIDSFKLFDKPYALTGGGPGLATETLSLFLFRQGFRFFEMGAASATGIVMVIIAGGLAIFYAVAVSRRSADG